MIPRSPDTIEEVYKWQNEQIMKAEATKVRSYAFERRQRLPYLIQKGLAKPGTISYDILRRAATSVHIARICVNVLKEQVTKTKWTIQPIDPLDDVDEEKVKKLTALFRHPNKNNETFRTLLDKLLEDLLVLDAASIEKTRFNDGELAELHYVDSATIRPVYDEHGNQDIIIPLQGEDSKTRDLPVSYVQVLDSNPYGGREAGQLVAAWPKKDFIYFNMHPQGSMGSFGYGLSPLEAVIGVVANILNADNFNGTYFEEGAFPPMIIQLKQNMDERDLQAMREYMYTELEGRFHRPAIIGGDAEMEIKSLKDITQRDMQFMDYMVFMATLLAAAYGLSKQDIGLTEDINRATAEVQQDLSQAKGYGSILNLLKEIFNQEIIWKDYGFTELEFEWVAPDSSDPKELKDITDVRLRNGSITVNEVRKMFGQQPYGPWADEPMLLTTNGYIPMLNTSAKEEPDVDESPGNEKPYEQQSKKVKKSIQSQDGLYEVFVDDRGVSQPFIFYDIITARGRVIKPPVAVNLDSQKLEEEWSQKLFDDGLNVVPAKRVTESEVLNNVLPSEELVKEFINYQNMTPSYDSKKWSVKYGHSRKYPYYIVSKYVEGRNLKDPLLIEDMKRVPKEYEQVVKDLAEIWKAEKKYVLGDRRADQYLITTDKRGWGFDYQFVGNKSRWEGTKNAIYSALAPIPELQSLFNKLIAKDDTIMNKMKKIVNKKGR